MQKKLIYSFLLMLNALGAMEQLPVPVSTDDAQIKQIVEEINKRKFSEYAQKVQKLLNHTPFPQEVTEKDFCQMRKLCKYKYAPLLRGLLGKVIDPNTFFMIGQLRITLLMEAMSYFSNPYQDKNTSPYAYDSVKALLEAGADPNQEGQSYGIKTLLGQGGFSEAFLYSQRPLEECALDAQMAALLLQANANPNLSNSRTNTPILFSLLYSYDSEDKSKRPLIYETIKTVLAKGADTAITQIFSAHQVTDRGLISFLQPLSPIEYAQNHDYQELVQLLQAPVKDLGKS